jgi:tetratricopeptide (TPR) repeat protein
MKKRKEPRSKTPFIQTLRAERESLMGAIGKVLREKDFSSIEEANEFLKQFVGMQIDEASSILKGKTTGESDEEKADRIFVNAMEKDSIESMRRRLRDVLKVKPDHVRALTAMAVSERTAVRAEKGLREAIAIGEKSVAPLIEESKGELWGFCEARPYLEARYYLAEFLAMREKRISEAIEECQAILALNTNDNQGVRDLLLGLLFEEQRYDVAEQLLEQYENDGSTIWMYGKVLLSFVRSADEANLKTEKDFQRWFVAQIQSGKSRKVMVSKEFESAEVDLEQALEQNPWGAIYILLAQTYLETPLPESYAEGSEEEARMLLEFQGMAWMRHPSAIIWLMIAATPWLSAHGFDSALFKGMAQGEE